MLSDELLTDSVMRSDDFYDKSIQIYGTKCEFFRGAGLHAPVLWAGEWRVFGLMG